MINNISIFTKRIIKEKFLKNYSKYKLAAEITNVPATMLAAVHFRENSMLDTTDSPSGPLQFDPPLTMNQMEKLFNKYSDTTSSEKLKYLSKGQMDLETALILSGCFLQEKMILNKCDSLTLDLTTKNDNHKDIIMKAFLFYNGKKYGTPMDSPYVVNMIDQDHKNMRLYGSVIDSNGNRKKVDIKDTRPGAYLVMNLLDTYYKIKYHE